MKVTLYSASSADGYIATSDGDSEWVSPADTEIFNKKIKEIGCIILGRTTFDQYQGELFPVKDVTNIVLTTNKLLMSKHPNVFYSTSPTEALKTAKKLKHQEVLIVGGGKTNGLFLESQLIDEIYVSIYPLVFGQGIKLFDHTPSKTKLKLIGQQKIDNEIIQLHYQVLKLNL